MLLHSSTHSLQMNTPGGPAMSWTCRRAFAQKVQRSSLPRLSPCFIAPRRPPRPRSAASARLRGGRILRPVGVLVHPPVGDRLGRVHVVVPVGVLLHLLDLLAAVLRDQVVELLLELEDLVGLDADVRGGAAGATPGLMDHHAAVREDMALPLAS